MLFFENFDIVTSSSKMTLCAYTYLYIYKRLLTIVPYDSTENIIAQAAACIISYIACACRYSWVNACEWMRKAIVVHVSRTEISVHIYL